MTKYIKPSTQIIELEEEIIIAGSGGTAWDSDGQGASTNVGNAEDSNGDFNSDGFRSNLWGNE